MKDKTRQCSSHSFLSTQSLRMKDEKIPYEAQICFDINFFSQIFRQSTCFLILFTNTDHSHKKD